MGQEQKRTTHRDLTDCGFDSRLKKYLMFPFPGSRNQKGVLAFRHTTCNASRIRLSVGKGNGRKRSILTPRYQFPSAYLSTKKLNKKKTI